MSALDNARRKRANAKGKPAEKKANEPADDAMRTPAPRPKAWPDPIAKEAYHGLAGEVVRALEPASEADPVALLVQTLILFGNVVGRGPHFAVEGDKHFTNQFAVLVGPTGSGRKGTSFGRVRGLFADLDPDWLDKRVVSGVSSGEGLLWQVRDPVCKRERVGGGRGQPPAYEVVESDPGEPDKRLTVHEPEFATVLKQAERQGNTASVVLRQLWDGREVVQSLTKNAPAKATAAHVSVVGHITPEELLRYLTATETANGFANRHLFLCVRRSKHLPDGGTPNPDALALLKKRLADAVAFARSVGEVTRHPSARGLWRGVYPTLTGERAGLSGALSARAAPHVLRLATLYALLDCSAVILPAHLMAGVAVWDYCERSVEFLFADRTGNPVADEVLDLLRATANGLTRTELVAALGRHTHGDKLTAALLALERAGLARREKAETGGRPSERWHATNKGSVTSPLMDATRRLFATTATCDESDQSRSSDAQEPPFGRFGRLRRNPGTDRAAVGLTPVPPTDLPPVWDDSETFFTLMDSRGMTWPAVLAWVNENCAPGAPYPANAEFFDLLLDHRKAAVGYLERLTPAGRGSLFDNPATARGLPD